ncbi:MAG TPA: phage portal protein [Pseudonocardiaceae bacterium]
MSAPVDNFVKLALAAAEPDDTPSGGLGDLIAGLSQLDDAMPGYHKAGQYYSGEIPEFFASPRLRRAMMRTGAAFRFNFAKIPVDAVVERLKLAAVTCADTTADSALRDIWLRNKIALQSRQIIRRACEFGDAYVIVWPSDDDSGVDIFYNSAQCVRIVYDTENPLLKSYAVKRWEVGGKRHRADVYYPDRIEKWITKPGAKGEKPGDWMQFTDEDGTWPVDNPFGEIPVFHFRTDQPYGEPVHKGFYGPQDAIHKLILSHMAGVDYQAFPQRYALMAPDMDSSEPAAEDEDIFAFADSGTGSTVPPAGEGRSQFSADPGSVWYMRGLTGVGQFDTAQHQNFTEPMLTYLRFGSEVTNTPLHRIDPTGDAPSGQSLRAAEAPFVHKIEDLQLSFGDTWRELFGFSLRVAGIAAEVTVRWTPAQTVDDLEGWQTVAEKMDCGVPPAQAFLEAGYSDEQVEKWFGPEGEMPRPVPAPPPMPTPAPPPVSVPPLPANNPK